MVDSNRPTTNSAITLVPMTPTDEIQDKDRIHLPTRSASVTANEDEESEPAVQDIEHLEVLNDPRLWSSTRKSLILL
jgi:hypothetical protein